MSDGIPCPFCQHVPPFKVVEQQQAPYRGLFQAMVERVRNLSPDVPVYRGELDRWLVELWDEMPEARAMIAVRTTELGREAGSLG